MSENQSDEDQYFNDTTPLDVQALVNRFWPRPLVIAQQVPQVLHTLRQPNTQPAQSNQPSNKEQTTTNFIPQSLSTTPDTQQLEQSEEQRRNRIPSFSPVDMVHCLYEGCTEAHSTLERVNRHRREKHGVGPQVHIFAEPQSVPSTSTDAQHPEKQSARRAKRARTTFITQNKIFHCPQAECRKFYVSEAGLNKHLSDVHNLGPQAIDIIFTSEQSQVTPSSTYQPNDSSSNAALFTISDSTTRVSKRLKTTPRPISQSNDPTAATQQAKHHEAQAQPFIFIQQDIYFCDDCKSLFKTNYQLAKHHEAGHNYECTSCDVVFSTHTALQEHQDNDHQPHKHRCYDCDKTFFPHLFLLEKHREAMHQDKITANLLIKKLKQNTIKQPSQTNDDYADTL